jgi:hypothetical protein
MGRILCETVNANKAEKYDIPLTKYCGRCIFDSTLVMVQLLKYSITKDDIVKVNAINNIIISDE